MAINRVDVTVLNLFELAQQTVNDLSDGCLAWVQQEGCFCCLVKNNTGIVADGINIISPLLVGPGSGWANAFWFRLNIGSSQYASQATWYVDVLNGNDANDGLTLITALASHEEIRRRIGSATINRTVTINIANDMGATQPINVFFNIGPSGRLNYFGVGQTVLFTGAFTAVTAINRGTNSAMIVADSSIPTSWTASNMINTVNSTARRIRITSGARAGALSWGALDLGTKQANTCNFALPSGFPPTQILPQVGDPYVVEQLTRVQEVNLRSNAGCATAQPPWITFNDLDFRATVAGTSFRPVADVLTGSIQPCVSFAGCAIGFFGLASSNLMACVQCRVGGNIYHHTTGTLGISGGLILSQMFIHPGAFVQLGFDALVQSVNIVVDGVLTYDSFCVQNAPAGNSGVLIRNGGNAFANDALYAQAGSQQIYGAANARYGIECFANGSLVYSTSGTKPSITGALNDTFIGGAAKAYAAVPFRSGYDGITVGTGNGAQIVAGP